jgi:hypothetical protein
MMRCPNVLHNIYRVKNVQSWKIGIHLRCYGAAPCRRRPPSTSMCSAPVQKLPNDFRWRGASTSAREARLEWNIAVLLRRI